MTAIIHKTVSSEYKTVSQLSGVSEELLGTLAGKLIAGTLAVLDQARLSSPPRPVFPEEGQC